MGGGHARRRPRVKALSSCVGTGTLGILRLRKPQSARLASLRMTGMSAERGDEGFLLLGALVLIFLVMLALSVAAPRIAKSLKREKEVESARRANQYVRGIRMYYKKFGRYPSSVEQLEKSNNQRFLRKQYVDPLTGKADWRLIHLGENQTKVKGFFGEELQGLQAGLGSAAGMASGFGGSTTAGAGSAFGNNTPGVGAGGAAGAAGASVSAPGAGGLNSGASVAPSAAAGATGGLGGASATTATGGVSGGFPTGTGGLIMGVGSSASGESIVDVNEQSTYETWEFLYDPRLEQLYAKGNLLGGGTAGSSSGGGLGSLNGSQSGGMGTGTGTNTGTPGTNTGAPATGTGLGNGSRTTPP